MITINARIVAEARSFLNTPFHLQGRKKGIGVDCIGLIIGIAESLTIYSKQGGLIKDYDILNYSIFDGTQYLKKELTQHLEETNFLNLGNIVLFQGLPNSYHLGIIADYSTDNFSLIHACISRSKVVEHRLTDELKNKIIKIYQFVNRGGN